MVRTVSLRPLVFFRIIIVEQEASSPLSHGSKAIRLFNREDLTAYKIAYSAVDEKTEDAFKSLKILVDVRRFELPTPCLQSRFEAFLKSMKFCGSEEIENKSVAARALRPIEVCGRKVLRQPQNHLQHGDSDGQRYDKESGV